MKSFVAWMIVICIVMGIINGLLGNFGWAAVEFTCALVNLWSYEAILRSEQ